MSDISYEIVETVGILSENSSGWRKELNKVSWNGRVPKYDLRDWAPDCLLYTSDAADEL